MSLGMLMQVLKRPDHDTVTQLVKAFYNKARFKDLMTIIKDEQHQYPLAVREMVGIHALYVVETSLGSESDPAAWTNPEFGRVNHLVNIATALPQLTDRATRVTYHFLQDELAIWEEFLRDKDSPEDPHPHLRLVSND